MTAAVTAAPTCPTWCDRNCRLDSDDPGTALHRRTIGAVTAGAEITGQPADRVDVTVERYDDLRGHSEPAQVCVGGLHLDLAGVLELQRLLSAATVLIGCRR